jgi:hypothetical protein
VEYSTADTDSKVSFTIIQQTAADAAASNKEAGP